MPPPYKPANICIYCNSIRYWKDPKKSPTAKLGDEHIIPASLRGNLILKRASCHECEAVTSKIEDECATSLFAAARPHLNLYRNRKRKIDSVSGTFYKDDIRYSIKMPKNNHPGHFITPIFQIPGLLCGRDPAEKPTWRFRMIVANTRWEESELSGQFMSSGRPVSNRPFARLLAKIAHSFVTAEVGHGNFIPFLPNYILRGKQGIFHYVGSVELSGKDKTTGHYLAYDWLTVGPARLLVAKIRLFQGFNVPTHIVVCGVDKPPDEVSLLEDGFYALPVNFAFKFVEG
jgi:hypothetical protein